MLAVPKVGTALKSRKAGERALRYFSLWGRPAPDTSFPRLIIRVINDCKLIAHQLLITLTSNPLRSRIEL